MSKRRLHVTITGDAERIARRGTTASLRVRPHLRRTGWLYSLASRPGARRALHALGLTYVPPRDALIVGAPLTAQAFEALDKALADDNEAMRQREEFERERLAVDKRLLDIIAGE